MRVSMVNRTGKPTPFRGVGAFALRVACELQRMKRWHKTQYGISIVLVRDSEVASHNQQFRGVRGPTDVLSFDYGDFGELLLAPGVISRRARREHVSPSHIALQLVIHGMLHLAGIHHGGSLSQDAAFDRVERALGRKLRIPLC